MSTHFVHVEYMRPVCLWMSFLFCVNVHAQSDTINYPEFDPIFGPPEPTITVDEIVAKPVQKKNLVGIWAFFGFECPHPDYSGTTTDIKTRGMHFYKDHRLMVYEEKEVRLLYWDISEVGDTLLVYHTCIDSEKLVYANAVKLLILRAGLKKIQLYDITRECTYSLQRKKVIV